MLNFSTRNGLVVFLLFACLSVMLRFFSFFPSVVDHDESTYLEIARMMLEGKTLYIDMVDIKPPGIFLILAIFQWIFGYSIFVIRLLVAIWIALTAYLLFLAAKKLLQDNRAALAAGIIYLIFMSTWSFFGISITPEIFFNLFTVASLLVLISSEKQSRFLWAGLMAGLGFIVKYLVLLDFAAFLLVMTFIAMQSKKSSPAQRIFSIMLAGTGFLLPFASINLWYFLHGNFEVFFNIIYLAPSRYPSEFDAWKMLKFLLDFLLRFFPLVWMFGYVLWNKQTLPEDCRWIRKLLLVWTVAALIAVMAAGKTFGHYMIQLMLPLSLGAGMFFHREIKVPRLVTRLAGSRHILWIFIAGMLGISLLKLEYVMRKDIPAEVADYLEPRLKSGEVIYTGNYHHIIYYLLKQDSPTKYVHRSLLLFENHIHALDIDTEREFELIMAQRPVYIIVKKEYPVKIMQDFISENYMLEKKFDGEVLLFRRKEIDNP